MNGERSAPKRKKVGGVGRPFRRDCVPVQIRTVCAGWSFLLRFLRHSRKMLAEFFGALFEYAA